MLPGYNPMNDVYYTMTNTAYDQRSYKAKRLADSFVVSANPLIFLIICYLFSYISL